ncbi:MAG: hypothetical protein J5787_03765 [Alphaproteobacteria bacterium]|nr:hypothetical protein [Alphaproteobacteria bacterium]
MDASGLAVTHEYGAATIPFSDLPDNLREKYSEQEKKFEAEKQARAEAMRKQQEANRQREQKKETSVESANLGNLPSKSGENAQNSEKKTSAARGPTVEYTGPRTIYIGPRGGRYYINSHGKKTYIRRKK